MRPNLLLSAFLLLPLIGRAQTQNKLSPEFYTENARNITNVFDNGFDIVPYNLHDGKIKGSPMLLPYWVAGEILLAGNKKATQVPVKYDIFRQELRVRRTQGDSILVPTTRVQAFTLSPLNRNGDQQQRRFIRCASPSLPAELNGTCAELLGGGEHLQLLKFWRKTVAKITESSTNIAITNSSYEFNEEDKYYLRWASDGRMVAIRLKRGSLKDALAGQPAALQALENQKGTLSSEQTIGAAVTTIDPLLTPARP